MAESQHSRGMQDASSSSPPTVEETKPQTVAVNSTQLSDEDLLLASTYIKDAVHSRHVYFKTDASSLRVYQYYNHIGFKIALYLCIWALLALALFEHPAVDILKTPYWATMIVELVCVGFFAVRLAWTLRFTQSDKFWRDPKNVTVLVTIILIVIDMICYIIWKNVAPPSVSSKAVRWSRVLRPLFLINFSEGRQLRKAFRNIRRTLPDVFHVLVLFISSIAVFALLAFKLMEHRNLNYPSGKQYFQRYWESFWDLYVLVTTANSPDVMMPAYDDNGWFALFFIVYLIVNLYIFMNIVLASIYNNYKRHLKNEVRGTVYLRRRHLAHAFELLKVWREGRDVICKDAWHQVMRLVDEGRSAAFWELLFSVLDDHGHGFLEKKEWLKLADLLSVQVVEVKKDPVCFEKVCAPCYLSRASEFVKMVVLSRYFHWFFDLLIFINAIFIGLNMEQAEYFFLPAFVIEIGLTLYTLGPKKYFTSFWPLFDFVVVMGAVIATIILSLSKSSDESRATEVDFLMVVRLLKLTRVFNSFERFRIVLTTIVAIGPSILTYGAVIFERNFMFPTLILQYQVFFYVYAILGMEIFNGEIDYYGYGNMNDSAANLTAFCGNVKLNSSLGREFYVKRYCSNNFNSFTQALVLLFELMVVNQWHVLADGFSAVTSNAARLYFITFHLLCVVILLNIFTAFVLEIFVLEYSMSKGKLEATLEARIRDMGIGVEVPHASAVYMKQDKTVLVEEEAETPTTPEQTEHPREFPVTTSPNDTNRQNGSANTETEVRSRFKLRESGSKRVETLLQHLFQGEIDAVDEGLEFGDAEPQVEFPQKLTFDTVA